MIGVQLGLIDFWFDFVQLDMLGLSAYRFKVTPEPPYSWIYFDLPFQTGPLTSLECHLQMWHSDILDAEKEQTHERVPFQGTHNTSLC